MEFCIFIDQERCKTARATQNLPGDWRRGWGGRCLGGRRMGAVGGVIPRFEPLLEDHNETGRSRLIRLSRRRLGGPSCHIMLCAGVEWRLSPYLECNSLRRLKMLLLDVAAARRLRTSLYILHQPSPYRLPKRLGSPSQTQPFNRWESRSLCRCNSHQSLSAEAYFERF